MVSVVPPIGGVFVWSREAFSAAAGGGRGDADHTTTSIDEKHWNRREPQRGTVW